LKDRMRTELYKQYCQESDKLFAEKIHYEDGNATLNAPNQYNGNISWVETQVGNRRKQAFGYQYDNLDRLTNSQFADTKMDGSFNTLNNKYNESIVYEDLRGNIKNLIRRGVYTGYSYGGTTYYCHGEIDNLTYTYDDNTNKLIGINDISGRTQGVKSGNWAYEYDVNGNMIKDYSKGLTIKYNYLNLPYEFTFATGARIYMTYNADGRKLRKDVYSPQGVLTQYDYAGQFEYKDGIMESINWGTGRLIKDKVTNTHRMEYFLQDHLGNTRVTFADVDGNGVINGNNEIVQENHYYAFGMNMQGAWNNMSVSGSPRNNYQYNGKEWNAELGLNDYGARWYDPAVGRWGVVDPKAARGSSISPYGYCFNNPVLMFDPDGAWPWPIWVRSFISVPHVAGGTFKGDGRGPSLSDRSTATSRTFVNFTFDPQKQSLTNKNIDADKTVFYGATIPTPTPIRLSPTEDKAKPIAKFREVETTKNSFGNNISTFGVSYSAKDPITPSLTTPSLDVHSNFAITENLNTGFLFVNATFTGDVFPSTEAFITDQSGAKLFLGARQETGGIADLFGDNKKELFNVDMQIKIDNNGNFKGVQQGGNLISPADWNKQVQSNWGKKQ
jgi:RHS repeat-associated protein